MSTDRMEIVIQRRVMQTGLASDRRPMLFCTMLDRHVPLILRGCMILVEIAPLGWHLEDILIQDESRRQGFGTEAIDWARREYGDLMACWASPSGRAFATSYEAKRGRQRWKIVTDEEDADAARFMESLRGPPQEAQQCR